MQERPALGFSGDTRAWDLRTGKMVRQFRAFDAKSGKVVWEVQLDAGVYNTPITFQGRDRKQYVVAHAAGGGFTIARPTTA